DVTIQAQILDLMKKLQNDIGMAIALITHDLGVIAEVVERVVVMYAGKIVEEAPVGELFARPLHPYTLGLLGSIPAIDKKTERLKVIPGIVPNPMNLPPGCRFNPRCEYVMDICREQEPEIRKIGPDHSVRCWLREK
ncbi:MAG TPA: ABC transporter ATP-binding protein, partial [Firmicutes bacterium]|nr:ABC transporter ATP-binding protein [Bacillota bacterium]